MMLPREQSFVRSAGPARVAAADAAAPAQPQLLATFGVGFGVLFNFLATFTYVSFHLAAPPYGFSSTLLGAIFVTYLVGTVFAPMAGRAIALFGRRRFTIAVIGVWVGGALLMLAPQVRASSPGLTICAGCGMLCQAVSTGYVTVTARKGAPRQSAST